MRLSKRELITQRNRTESFSEMIDWGNLGDYCRQVGTKASLRVFLQFKEEMGAVVGTLKYPRPIFDPPFPSSSGIKTPAASVHGSDDESESVDSEEEKEEFQKSNGSK